MTDPQTFRTVLRDAGFPEGYVVIADGAAEPLTLPGALTLRFDAGWNLAVEDYGMSERLAHFDTFDEVAEVALQYLSGLSAPSEHLDDSGLAAAIDAQAAYFVELRAALASSTPLGLSLPAGTVVDHQGTPDGLLLYLPDSKFSERSLPVHVIDATRTDFGRFYYRVEQPFRVQAAIVPPFYGQPGGALYFRLSPATTIRRLLAAGSLRRVEVSTGTDPNTTSTPRPDDPTHVRLEP